jgi:hypothetical protein
MQIVLVDSRMLGIMVVQPAKGMFWNWSTSLWETPFNAANHVQPCKTMEQAPSVFSAVVYASVGPALTQYLDSALLICTIDASGNVINVIDNWALPNPLPAGSPGSVTAG